MEGNSVKFNHLVVLLKDDEELSVIQQSLKTLRMRSRWRGDAIAKGQCPDLANVPVGMKENKKKKKSKFSSKRKIQSPARRQRKEEEQENGF